MNLKKSLLLLSNVYFWNNIFLFQNSLLWEMFDITAPSSRQIKIDGIEIKGSTRLFEQTKYINIWISRSVDSIFKWKIILNILYYFLEKHELVELLCSKHIPEKQKKGVEKLTANFAGSVPNIRPLNEFLGKWFVNLDIYIISDSFSLTIMCLSEVVIFVVFDV